MTTRATTSFRKLLAAIGGLWLLATAAGLGPSPVSAEVSFGVNRTLYVAANGTPEENCQSLQDTLTSISDNSATNRYVVNLEPGSYYCGGSSVIVGEWIALVGSGAGHTFVAGTSDNATLGLVHINGSGAQVRSMSITNQYPGTPTYRAIALGIRKLLSAGLINDIRLEDVSVGSTDVAILAYNAQFRAWTSSLGTVEHEGPVGMTAVSTIHYCNLNSITGSAPKRCYLSQELVSGDVYDLNCILPFSF